MGKRRITPKTYSCYRCGWRWVPRKAEYPRVCPHCHSSRWYDSKTDEELYWHWLEWAVGMHWLEVFRLVGAVANGKPVDRARAKRLVRSITDKAIARAKDERPALRQPPTE